MNLVLPWRHWRKHSHTQSNVGFYLTNTSNQQNAQKVHLRTDVHAHIRLEVKWIQRHEEANNLFNPNARMHSSHQNIYQSGSTPSKICFVCSLCTAAHGEKRSARARVREGFGHRMTFRRKWQINFPIPLLCTGNDGIVLFIFQRTSHWVSNNFLTPYKHIPANNCHLMCIPFGTIARTLLVFGMVKLSLHFYYDMLKLGNSSCL